MFNFFKNINVLTILVCSLSLINNSAVANTTEFSFAYIGDKNNKAYLGVLQGLDESNLQGQFLNQKYSVDIISPDAINQSDLSGYIALIAAVDKPSFKQLVNSQPDFPVFNINLDDDDLRSDCTPNALHIIPSHKMKNDAIKQWQKKNPESNNVSAHAWHPDFVKFAARDLNKRFLKIQKTEMDDVAWAGWAAVKMTSDSVARNNITASKHMLDYLKTELLFDGQKGTEMNFRETGQLRQIILLVEDDKIVAEAPVRGVAKPPSVDSLGLLNCPK